MVTYEGNKTNNGSYAPFMGFYVVFSAPTSQKGRKIGLKTPQFPLPLRFAHLSRKPEGKKEIKMLVCYNEKCPNR